MVGCATTQQTTQPTTSQPVVPGIDEQQVQTTPAVEEPSAPQEQKKEIPQDIKDVLEKGKTSLTSYSYNYKNPEIDESYQIYVKDNKIKIVPPEIINVEAGKFYNTIYIDTEAKTAEAYCVGYSDCSKNLGKVKDLAYDEAYIETPKDWIGKVTEAEKIDKRTVERKEALYLQTNIGKVTIASYNGFIYKIEDENNVWEFTDAAFNSVTDSDITPP